MATTDRQRADEALDWVRRIHDPSFVDWEGHAAWLEADPRNLRAFDEASSTIEAATAGLAPAGARPAAPVPINDNPVQPATARRRWHRWGAGLGMAVAAGLVALVTAPTLIHGDTRPYLVQTAAGEQRSIDLDGTAIMLNGASRLRLDHADPRVATLEAGEAFFAVRHDPARPFEVHVGDATFQDVGTAFDIVRRSGATEIAVSEGAVLYDPGKAAIRLDRGQSMRIAANTATVRPVDAATVGGWRTGRLLYRDEPLTEVAADVARSIGEPVSVDPAVAQRRFSGVVQVDSDRPRMFRRMAAVMGVTIRRAPQGWQVVSPDR